MQTQDANLNTDKKPRGRKDAAKQEAIITMQPIKDAIDDLVGLHEKAGAAADKFNDAVKATAEKAGLLASVVRKFVQARAGEKFEEEKTKCEQLSLVFTEVGQHFS